VDEKSLQLLKVMREQLGESAASRTVDAVAAASSLGMYPETLHRSLLYLVRAGYLEESADHAMTTQGLYLITFQGIAAIDNALSLQSATGEAQEVVQRPWWRKLIQEVTERWKKSARGAQRRLAKN
jgi:DNA-binding IclR family transcriptional regulator